MKLIALALFLVAAVLGGQVAAGGGDFVPRSPPHPARPRGQAPGTPGSLEPLAEAIVLAGLAETACDEGVSRERLVLDIGTGEDVDAEALRTGLERAVEGLGDALPPVSALLDEALDLTDLPGIAKGAIRAVPDGIVDDLLPTDEVLRRAIAELDVEAVLANLDDPEAALRDALIKAVGDQVKSSIEDLVPNLG